MSSEASTGAAQAAERRKAPRFGCAGAAEIVVPGRGLRYRGRVVDLSAGGCFIEAECRLERGTAVELWMEPEGEPLRILAHLVVRRPNGIGCSFHGLTERKMREVNRLMGLLAEEARLRAAAEAMEGQAAGEQCPQPA